MKKILAIAMALVLAMALSVSVFADWAVGPLSIDNFGSSGWDSTYDAASHVITPDHDWVGKGWWIAGDSSLYAGYDALKIAFPNGAETGGQVVVEFADGAESVTVPFAAGDAEVVIPIDPASSINQIYVQIGADPKPLTIGEVTMQVEGTGAAEAEPEATETETTEPETTETAPETTETTTETTTEETASAPSTGLALAVVPAVVALAAAVVSKKR